MGSRGISHHLIYTLRSRHDPAFALRPIHGFLLFSKYSVPLPPCSFEQLNFSPACLNVCPPMCLGLTSEMKRLRTIACSLPPVVLAQHLSPKSRNHVAYCCEIAQVSVTPNIPPSCNIAAFGVVAQWYRVVDEGFPAELFVVFLTPFCAHQVPIEHWHLMDVMYACTDESHIALEVLRVNEELDLKTAAKMYAMALEVRACGACFRWTFVGVLRPSQLFWRAVKGDRRHSMSSGLCARYTLSLGMQDEPP